MQVPDNKETVAHDDNPNQHKHQEMLDTIHKKRDQLRGEEYTLYMKQVELNKETRALQRKWEQLYATCSHPNDKRKRTGGPYSEREWHCPDCGRIC
jgi:hypothetical protein